MTIIIYMTTLEQYLFIILPRQAEPLPEDAITEEHHIWPTSCGGPDEDWNKVKLLPKEHFRAHQLLIDLYTDEECHRRMAAAAWCMAHTRDGIEVTEEEYGRLRREFVIAMKERPSPSKGKKWSKESREKLSKAKKGKLRPDMKGRTPWNKGKKTGPHSEESNRKRSLTLKGRVVSQETRQKLSTAMTGMHQSEESKQKNRVAHLGRKHTEEWKRMMSARAKAGYPRKS